MRISISKLLSGKIVEVRCSCMYVLFVQLLPPRAHLVSKRAVRCALKKERSSSVCGKKRMQFYSAHCGVHILRRIKPPFAQDNQNNGANCIHQ